MANLFFSYSHKDEELRDALEVHLSMLKRQGLIEAFHDRRIVAGDALDPSIDAYVEEADVILCLVSPDFIASDYCYSREMARALERHQAGETQVIPVILRHCEWQQTPLKNLRGTPLDNRPVKAWADRDEALHAVTADVRQAVERISAPKKSVDAEKPAEPGRSKGHATLSRPRSANLQVPRVLTDKDRDDHLADAFEYLAEFFANSIAELSDRHQGLDGRFTRLDARRFTASAYRDGKKMSAITVFTGGDHWGSGRSVNFNNSDTGATNTSNGSYSLPERGEQLHFSSHFGSYGQDKPLDQEGVAEAIWAVFMNPLQRR